MRLVQHYTIHFALHGLRLGCLAADSSHPSYRSGIGKHSIETVGTSECCSANDGMSPSSLSVVMSVVVTCDPECGTTKPPPEQSIPLISDPACRHPSTRMPLPVRTPYLLLLGLKDFDPPITVPLFLLSRLVGIPLDFLHSFLLDFLGPDVDTGVSVSSTRRVSADMTPIINKLD